MELYIYNFSSFGRAVEQKTKRPKVTLKAICSVLIVFIVLFIGLCQANMPVAEATVNKTPCLVLLPLKLEKIALIGGDLRFLNTAFNRLLAQNGRVIVKRRGDVYEFFEHDGKRVALSARSRRDLARAGRALGVDGFLLPVVKKGTARNNVTLALHYFSTEMARVSWVREHIEPIRNRHGRNSQRLKAYMRAFARNISSLTPQLKLLLSPTGSGRRTYDALPPSPLPFFQRALDYSAFSPTPIATEGYERGVEQLDLRLTDFAARDRVLGETPVKAALVRYQRKGQKKQCPYALRVVDLDSPKEAKRYVEGMFPDMPAHGLAGVDVRAVRYDEMDFSAVGTALGKFAVVAEGPKGAESDLVELLRQAIRTNRRISNYYRNNPHHPGRTKVVEKPAKPWSPPKEPVIQQTIDEAMIRRIVLEVLKPLGVLPKKNQKPAMAPTPAIDFSHPLEEGVSLPPSTPRVEASPTPIPTPTPTRKPAPVPLPTRRPQRVKTQAVNEGAVIQADIAKRLMTAHRFEQAAKHYQKALKMDPSYEFARQQLAMLQTEHGIRSDIPARPTPVVTRRPIRRPVVTRPPLATKAPVVIRKVLPTPVTITKKPIPTKPVVVKPTVSLLPTKAVKIKPAKIPTKIPTVVKIVPTPSFSTSAVTPPPASTKAAEKTESESSSAFDALTTVSEPVQGESEAPTAQTSVTVQKLTNKEKLQKILYSWPFGVFLIMVSILLGVLLFWNRQEQEMNRKEYLEMLAAATSAAREIEEARGGDEKESEPPQEEQTTAADLRARIEKMESEPIARPAEPKEPAAPAVIKVEKTEPGKTSFMGRPPTLKKAPFSEDTQVTKKNPLFSRLKAIRNRVNKKKSGNLSQSMLPSDE